MNAATDFDTMRTKTDGLLKKRKTRDTLRINGVEVLMNYRRSNYSANLLFPTDTAGFNTQWLYYQRALQAALGTGYVYHLYGEQEEPSIVYYYFGSDKPRVYLQLQKEYNNRMFIHISIESNFTHPTKRGLNMDDL